MENFCNHDNLDQASSKVALDSFFTLGINTVTGGKKAFLNVTREVLVKGYLSFLPPQQTVVEILETVSPDSEVLAACRKLKESGYLIALDDFVADERMQPLIEMADIIKIDFLATEKDQQKALAERLSKQGIKLLAEKVETPTVFEEAMAMGYDYFQGYFFCKPTILSGKEVPAFKLNYLRILREILRPDLDLNKIEEILKTEVSLSYQLLRYINSAFFGWQVEIRSIKHAMIMLGENDFKRWSSFIALASMAKDKPNELVFQAILRGRFLELLAPIARLADRAQDFFLLGTFSLIDAIIDRPLQAVLDDMPIADDIKAALLGEKGPLRDFLELALAHEEGDWEALSARTEKLKIEENHLPELYLKSLEWASESFYQSSSAE